MKKIFALIMGMLLLMTTVNVNAAIFFNEDFLKNPLPTELTFGASGSGGASNDYWGVSCYEAYKAFEVSDGVLKIQRPSDVTETSRVDISAKFHELDWEEGDSIITFDFRTGHIENFVTMNLFSKYYVEGVAKQDRLQAYIYSRITNGRNEVMFKFPAMRTDASTTTNRGGGFSFAANEWTTIAFRSRVEDGVWSLKIYYKGQNDTAFKDMTPGATIYPPAGSDLCRPASSEASSMVFISASGEASLEIDNMRVYNGVSVADSKVEFEGAVIETVDDIKSAGKITAMAYVLDASAVPGEEGTTIKTFMVAMDKKMKMLDCKIQDVTLNGGENTVTGIIEVSDEIDAQNYFGNLDGGLVEYYLWYDMMPLADGIGLK